MSECSNYPMGKKFLLFMQVSVFTRLSIQVREHARFQENCFCHHNSFTMHEKIKHYFGFRCNFEGVCIPIATFML